MNQVVTCELWLLNGTALTHCLLENTYTGTHSPQGSTDNQGTLSNLCSVRTSKQHELQPCTQASRCRTRDGGGPGEMDTHLNSRTPSASEGEEVSHLRGKEGIWLAAFWSSAHLLISRLTGQEEILKGLKQLRQEVRVPWSIPWEMSFIWDLGEGEKLWKPFEVNDLCI